MFVLLRHFYDYYSRVCVRADACCAATDHCDGVVCGRPTHRYVKLIVGNSKRKTPVMEDATAPSWEGMQFVFREHEDTNRNVGKLWWE